MEEKVPAAQMPRATPSKPKRAKLPPAKPRISTSAAPIKTQKPAAEITVRVVAASKELTERTKEQVSKVAVVLPAERFGDLLQAITSKGFQVIGPTVRDGAIVYDRIASVSELPAGWTDEQEAAHYRLQRRKDQALFGYAIGPQSWKKYFHPAEIKLWAAERENGAFRILNNEEKQPPRAFLGVRACELAAIAAQDRVLLGDKYRDPIYATRREGAFIIAVQCTHAAPTCFCASMGTGPEVKGGFDLRVTELLDGNHRFLIESGTERGARLLAEVEANPAIQIDFTEAQKGAESAKHGQKRSIETVGLKELLYQNFDSPQWDKIAARCLTCANCTMVCPTCFCTTVEDVSDVAGNHAERWRRWDSCFTLNFSYIHGGSIRSSSKARYRQWMTHKLAAWIDQFGSSGCVGCGRCITWCPAAIDITEEVRVMREGGNSGNTNS
jgi:sulfhydrogenase subunit beta (sulfur reductase)